MMRKSPGRSKARRLGSPTLATALVLVALSMLAAVPAVGATGAATGQAREVLVVSNNWDGTADFIDPQTFKRLSRLNIIPDKDERMAEIQADPVKLGFFLGIREFVGEGHDQFVDARKEACP